MRDGLYAGMDARSGELVFFHVEHHRVYHLRFSLTLTCLDFHRHLLATSFSVIAAGGFECSCVRLFERGAQRRCTDA